MNPYKMLSAWLAMATAISAGFAFANNNLFLPGDAFFPTVLTKADVEALLAARNGERSFKYSSFDGYELAFCGYAGYNTASIKAVDDAFANNLATVYGRVRQYSPRTLVEQVRDGKEELIESNGIRVLFYPADYAFPGRPLGLRYNENWIAEAVKFGHKRERVRLCSLIQDPRVIEEEWRDGEAVPPLKVQLPDIKPRPVPEITQDAVEVQGPVKAIVIGNQTLKGIYDCETFPQDFSPTVPTVYVVDSNGITELGCNNGNWSPPDAGDSDEDQEPEQDDVGINAWK